MQKLQLFDLALKLGWSSQARYDPDYLLLQTLFFACKHGDLALPERNADASLAWRLLMISIPKQPGGNRAAGEAHESGGTSFKEGPATTYSGAGISTAVVRRAALPDPTTAFGVETTWRTALRVSILHDRCRGFQCPGREVGLVGAIATRG